MADAVETPAERGFEAAGPDRARGRQAPRSRDPACRPEATDAVAARRFRVAAPDSGQPVLALHATLAVRRPRDARRRDQAGQENGRAHVCTPVTNAHLVCSLVHEKIKM